MNKLTYLLAVTVALCLSMSGQAIAQNKKLYSWTDENGVVHFTDTKPEGQAAEVRDIPDADQQAVARPYQPPATDGQPSLAQQRREEIQRSNQQARAEKAIKDRNCAAKRAEVARLEPNRRVFFTNEQGETERMDDVERTNQVAAAKAYIAANCN